jgi:hypothetical protein
MRGPGVLVLLLLWIAGSAAQEAAPSVPDARTALAAYAAFRAAPLERLDRSGPFLDYIRDSGAVHIVLDEDLLAWMYQPIDPTYKAALYAAYLGGNMAAQLAAGEHAVDGDIDGMASALEVYTLIRARDAAFTLPLFDTLTQARSDGRFADVVRTVRDPAP